MRDQQLTKMYSMPMPEVEDVRDDARDLEDEYEHSAGLKVREGMTHYVTKENLQRGAMTTTCTGPQSGEKAGGVRPHDAEHPVSGGEGLRHRQHPGHGDGPRGGSRHGLSRTWPRLPSVLQTSSQQNPKLEAFREGWPMKSEASLLAGVY